MSTKVTFIVLALSGKTTGLYLTDMCSGVSYGFYRDWRGYIGQLGKLAGYGVKVFEKIPLVNPLELQTGNLASLESANRMRRYSDHQPRGFANRQPSRPCSFAR
jgi:hypothetical protein